jgi:hypothetical protein
LKPEQAKRWEEIKQGFARVKRMGGREDDPVARVTGQLGAIEEQLGAVKEAVVQAAEVARQPAGPSPVVEVNPRLEALKEAVLEVAKVAREAKDVPPPPPPVVQVPPPPDMTPYLKHLAHLLKALADRAATPPPAPDLGPVMEQLTQAVKTMAERPAVAVPAAPPEDMGRYMEQMSQAMKAMAERPAAVTAPAPSRLAPLPPEVGRQLDPVVTALSLLASKAKQALNSEEDLKAMQVWQEVTEALNLLRAVQQRPAG